MKGVNWMVALGAVALVGAGVRAAVLPAPFSASYEGDFLPDSASSNPQWSALYTEGSASVSGGILTITTTGAQSEAYRYVGGTGTAWDPTGAGSTIEINLKVDSVDAGAGRAGDMLIATGTNAWLLRWGNGVISEELNGDSYLMATTDAFHTYRLTIPNDTGPMNLYVDGNTTAATSFAGVASGTLTRIDFGDTLDPGDGGVVQWDYIRWTNAGAYAPEAVPEPASLGVVALGGLALLRRRRA